MREATRSLLVLVAGIVTISCGYRVAETAGLPKHIRTIAISAFQNTSLQFRVEQRVTRAVIDELLRRGRRVRITSNPEGADAVLTGNIRSFSQAVALLDATGRARVYQVTMTVGVTLRDQTTNKVLFDNQNFVFRGEYELPEGPESLYDEEGPTVDRIAREFARSLVTTIFQGN